MGAPICSIVLQHFWANISIATWSTPSEPLQKKPFLRVYSCCGFWLWSWLAAVVNLFGLSLVCFVAPVYPKRAGWRTRTEKKKKRPCAVQGTWLHVALFSMQTLELYIPRLSRCTIRRRRRKPQNTSSPGVHETTTHVHTHAYTFNVQTPIHCVHH